jgi:hypothetical protein
MGGKPGGIPVQPGQLGHQAGGEFGFHPGLQAGQASFLGHGHVVLHSRTQVQRWPGGWPGSAGPVTALPVVLGLRLPAGDRRADPRPLHDRLRPGPGHHRHRRIRRPGHRNGTRPGGPSRSATAGTGQVALFLIVVLVACHRGVPVRAGPSGRTTRDEQYIFKRLGDNNGIDSNVASERLHQIKQENGLRGNDNVTFDMSGNVYGPNGDYLGSLTQGGK